MLPLKAFMSTKLTNSIHMLIVEYLIDIMMSNDNFSPYFNNKYK